MASAAKGRHLFSFGADLDWIREKVSAYDGFGAIYVFSTLDSFLNGQPDQYRQAFGNPNTNFATPRYSGFLQDHWTARQPTSRLMRVSATTSSTYPRSSPKIPTISRRELDSPIARHHVGR